MFKLNLAAQPEPIRVQWGKNGFTLRTTYLNAFERAAAIASLADGFAALCELLYRKVVTWEEVCNDDGTPMPMQRLDGEGSVVDSNLAKVMGRVPWPVQVEAAFIQLAQNGVRMPCLREVLSAYIDDVKELEAAVARVESFFENPKTPDGGC